MIIRDKIIDSIRHKKAYMITIIREKIDNDR